LKRGQAGCIQIALFRPFSKIRYSAIFKMAMENYPVLLAPPPSDSMLPLEVFDRKYLVEYPYRKIWLSEAEAWLPSDGLKFYTDGSLFEGKAGSGVFFSK
jgi:hypothetical protein